MLEFHATISVPLRRQYLSFKPLYVRATVLSRQDVTTPRHTMHPCRYVLRLRVRLGEHDLFNDNDGPVVDAVPEQIIVHENYTGRPTYTNDIAVIRLDRNVSYTGNDNAYIL